ncbi:MAG: hypothetical protein LBK42_06970 [Propionibacteriaceae bacterium]|jgi:hypothetical protein|nr:hypothetical protein [Propionibacteriaceae bacterium]
MTTEKAATPDVEQFWAEFSKIDAKLLDCVDVNLAVIIARRGVSDVRTPFAAEWHFDILECDGLITPTTSRRPIAERVRRTTGLRMVRDHLAGRTLTEVLNGFSTLKFPVLCYADAFYLPWSPYAGNEHVEHSFLVAGVPSGSREFRVADAYSNLTEWGLATPAVQVVSVASVERAMMFLSTSMAGTIYYFDDQKQEDMTFDLIEQLVENAHAVSALPHQEKMRRYSNFHQERSHDLVHMRSFVLGTWLAARSRKLHHLWLSDINKIFPYLMPTGFIDQFHTDVVEVWDTLQENAYIQSRRVARGRSASTGIFETLGMTLAANEARLAAALDTHLVRFTNVDT